MTSCRGSAPGAHAHTQVSWLSPRRATTMSPPLPFVDLSWPSATPILLGALVVYVIFAGLFVAAGLIRPPALRRALKVSTFAVVAASTLAGAGVIFVLSARYAIGRIHAIFLAPVTPI